VRGFHSARTAAALGGGTDARATSGRTRATAASSRLLGRQPREARLPQGLGFVRGWGLFVARDSWVDGMGSRSRQGCAHALGAVLHARPRVPRRAQAGRLTAHKHSGERPFACDETDCEYRATKAGHLTTHKRTHSGERPFACNEPGCEYRAVLRRATSRRTSTVASGRTRATSPGATTGPLRRATSRGNSARTAASSPTRATNPAATSGIRAAKSGHLTRHKRLTHI
jgi:hypothetical protein